MKVVSIDGAASGADHAIDENGFAASRPKTIQRDGKPFFWPEREAV